LVCDDWRDDDLCGAASAGETDMLARIDFDAWLHEQTHENDRPDF
jgi:hypothetical protein